MSFNSSFRYTSFDLDIPPNISHLVFLFFSAVYFVMKHFMNCMLAVSIIIN